MRLDLREIINIPGSGVSFDYEPDLSDALKGTAADVKTPVRAVGSVRNIAGVLHFSAEADAVLACSCARCLKDFEYPVHLTIETTLKESENHEEEPEVFLLDGDSIDADEIITTEFILNLEQRFLCSEDCRGLCEKCGADLNEGPCACKLDTDPRLAALGQLLEND